MDESVYLNDIWQEVLDFLKDDPDVGQGKVNIWFGLVRPVSFDKNSGLFKISVPNTMHRNTIHSRFENKISSFLKEMLLAPEISVVYEVSDSDRRENSENAFSGSLQKSSPDFTDSFAKNDSKEPSGFASVENKKAENEAFAELYGKKNSEIGPTNSETAIPRGSISNIMNAEWQPSIVRSQYRLKTEPSPEIKPDPNALHPDFRADLTFESFIEGPSNRFAVGAARAVVNERLSPLFIYSKPGLGKTHLLYAIAHGLFRKNHKVKIVYSDAENYVNEFLKAITDKKTDAFREKYRNQDCFLIDDVQFLLGKERSAEEFFYTFKNFLDLKKLIVITSDKPPNELAVDERIMSRFRSGVIADIKLPDFETRVAILHQINTMNNYGINIDVINFIAQKVHAGGRDLGGCLLNVKNFCMQTGAKPTIDIAQNLIKEMIKASPEGPVNIKSILKTVAGEYNIEVKDLVGSKREQRFVRPRHIAMYLASELTGMTLENIGKAFGGRSHSLVITAKKNIEKEIDDIYFTKHINGLIEKIKNVSNMEEY